MLRHQFGLFGFVRRFDPFVDELCDKAFTAYRDARTKELAKKASPASRAQTVLLPEHESELDRFVTSYAVRNIVQRSMITHHNFTFGRNCSELIKEQLPCEVRSRVAALCLPMGIEETSHEIKYYQPNRFHQRAERSMCDCADEFCDRHLCEASYDINSSCDTVVAVYSPCSEAGCKIDYFSEMWKEKKLSEIVLYCSCQEHISRGIPCQHQMQYIMTSESRNMQNVIWLCHPTYIRGHSKQ